MSTHSALRYEAALKVTGSAVYEAEVPAAGLLHAALVEAPISCGDVLSVDATQAIDLPGFAAMVSYADAEVLQASPATALIRERTIHFAGQPVALVTANTLQAAREAARCDPGYYTGASGGDGAGAGPRQVICTGHGRTLSGRDASWRRDRGRWLRPISSSEIDTRPPSTTIIPWNRTPWCAGGRAAKPWCTLRPRPSSAPAP